MSKIIRFYASTVKKRKYDSLKKVQNGKIENVAGSVSLSLFMDDTVNYRSRFLAPA
jgi:hypothetical protein